MVVEPGYNSLAFFDSIKPIDRRQGDVLHGTSGPMDFDGLHRRAFPQTRADALSHLTGYLKRVATAQSCHVRDGLERSQREGGIGDRALQSDASLVTFVGSIGGFYHASPFILYSLPQILR